MAGTNISVQTPFSFCDRCPNMSIDETKCYSGESVFCMFYRCYNSDICARTIELYLEELELEKIKQEPRPVIAYDNLMQILRIMENEAEEHPECQLKAVPLIQKIARICDDLKE